MTGRKSGEHAPGPQDVTPDLRVGFVLAPDFTLLPFAGFVDALRHAADEADRSRQIYCRWACLAQAIAPIRSSCGVEVLPDRVFGDPAEFDYVVVVGGLLPASRAVPSETHEFLRRAAALGVPLVALCTGSFILGDAGLIGGRRCAVHFRHRQELIEAFPDVEPATDETYVIDGGIITSPGGTAAIDLALEIIARHCGRARALKGLHDMVVDRHRAAHHVPERPYEDVLNCGDWRVARAVELMERNLGRPASVKTLAARLGTTTRQLDRAFAHRVGMPPTAFWRKMRLGHARWLLLNTQRTVTQIAYECGFSDCAHFSRWYKRTYSETPYAYRTRRRQVAAS